MTKKNPRVLIVEDERIVAIDLKITLERLGYDVIGTTGSGENAVEMAEDLQPDIILMDIRLEDKMDGIDAAKAIRKHSDIPVIFLTAYTDQETIDRAKLVGPYGYAVKPFEPRELKSAIEIATYKHSMERRLRESEARMRSVLNSLSDAVLLIDMDGRIRYANPQAYGYSKGFFQEMRGMRINEVMQIMHEGKEVSLTEGSREEAFNGEVIIPGSDRLPVDYRRSAVRDRGTQTGWTVVLRDLTPEKLSEMALKELANIITASEAGIFRVTPAKEISTWSRACEKITGIPEDSALGRSIMKTFAEDPTFTEAVRQVLDEGVATALQGHQIATKKGNTLPLGIHIAPLNDEAAGGVSVILCDLSDRSSPRTHQAIKNNLLRHLHR
jgi:PAS domain S-box-containing protein